jgi:hypothetical protein
MLVSEGRAEDYWYRVNLGKGERMEPWRAPVVCKKAG